MKDEQGPGYEPQEVAGRRVVVTGGTTGIGRAVARLRGDDDGFRHPARRARAQRPVGAGVGAYRYPGW